MTPILPKEQPFIKPFSLPRNPKSRLILQDFIDSKLSEAEVDVSWARDARLVYDRLYKYLTYNRHLGIVVTIKGDKVFLSKTKPR
jgi:hypothetical protein